MTVKSLVVAAAAAVFLPLSSQISFAVNNSTWINTSGNSTVNNLLWTDGTKWDTNPVYPNGVGDIATIASNQTANRLIDFGDNNTITLGKLNINNSTAFFNQLGTNGHGVTLVFNNGASDAELNVTGHTTTS